MRLQLSCLGFLAVAVCCVLATDGVASSSSSPSEESPLSRLRQFSVDTIFFGDPDEDEIIDVSNIGKFSINGEQADSYEEYIMDIIYPRLERNLCRQVMIGLTTTLCILMIFAAASYIVLHFYELI